MVERGGTPVSWVCWRETFGKTDTSSRFSAGKAGGINTLDKDVFPVLLRRYRVVLDAVSDLPCLVVYRFFQTALIAASKRPSTDIALALLNGGGSPCLYACVSD